MSPASKQNITHAQLARLRGLEGTSCIELKTCLRLCQAYRSDLQVLLPRRSKDLGTRPCITYDRIEELTRLDDSRWTKSQDHQNGVCPICQQRKKLFLCKRCSDIAYCSVECQKADWSEHKTYCAEPCKKEKSGPSFRPHPVPCSNRLLRRL